MFNIKRGDTSPALRRTLTDGQNVPIDITGATVTITMASGCGALVIDRSSCIVEAEGVGVVTYEWAPEDTETAGQFKAEFEVTYAGGAVETFPNTDFLIVNISPDLTRPGDVEV